MVKRIDPQEKKADDLQTWLGCRRAHLGLTLGFLVQGDDISIS